MAKMLCLRIFKTETGYHMIEDRYQIVVKNELYNRVLALIHSNVAIDISFIFNFSFNYIANLSKMSLRRYPFKWRLSLVSMIETFQKKNAIARVNNLGRLLMYDILWSTITANKTWQTTLIICWRVYDQGYIHDRRYYQHLP